MNIGTISENKNLEKRISVTPETVKKLTDLNFSVFLEKSYGEHLDIFDTEYKNNGATLFVPNSHKIRDLPDFKKNYKHKCFTGKAGTIIIMDSGLWHKTGNPSLNDRWGMFSVYGGWFVKPYFRYWDMKELKNKKLSKKFKKLLHLYSTPPINELKKMTTLIKFR